MQVLSKRLKPFILENPNFTRLTLPKKLKDTTDEKIDLSFELSSSMSIEKEITYNNNIILIQSTKSLEDLRTNSSDACGEDLSQKFSEKIIYSRKNQKKCSLNKEQKDQTKKKLLKEKMKKLSLKIFKERKNNLKNSENGLKLIERILQLLKEVVEEEGYSKCFFFLGIFKYLD